MFTVGDKVVLNSGGPVMTVAKTEQEEITCHWFLKDALKKQTFANAMLRMSTQNDLPPVKLVAGIDPCECV